MSKKALAGKRFLMTRPQAQAAPFAALIEAQGGEALCVPTIEIVPPETWAPFDHVMQDLEDFDIVILTSVNGVEAFFDRLLENNQYYGTLTQIFVVAVGPKTAQAIRDNHIKPDFVPADHRAEGIVEELLRRGVAGQRILYPRAELARPLIADSLRAAGATVFDPVAYRTVLPQGSEGQIRRLFAEQKLDAVCFSSASTFDNLYTMLGEELKELQGETKFFSIGPQTSAAIRNAGFEVDLEPQQWTLDALVAAMVDYYS